MGKLRSLRARGAGPLVANSFALVSGTVVTQVIVFLCSPFLARMFGLAEFGSLANYNAWVSILALASNLRYEHAIIVAGGRNATIRALALTLTLSVAGAFVVGAVAAVLYVFNGGGYLREIHEILLVIPLGILAVCLSSALTQFNIRLGQFKRIARVAVAQAIVTVVTQLALGLLHVRNALVIGTLFGYAASSIVLMAALVPHGGVSEVAGAVRLRALCATARRHVNFARYTLPADAISVLAKQFVPVFVLALFSPEAAGLYAFTLRIVRLPLLVVATAIANALRNGAVELQQRNEGLATLYRNTLQVLFALSFLPFVTMLLFSRQLFGLAFGKQWIEAGRVAQILSPGILMEFVAFPLSVFFLVTNTQSRSFFIQVVGLVSTLAALAIGRYLFTDFLATCALMSVAMFLVSTLSLVLGWREAVNARPQRRTETQRVEEPFQLPT